MKQQVARDALNELGEVVLGPLSNSTVELGVSVINVRNGTSSLNPDFLLLVQDQGQGIIDHWQGKQRQVDARGHGGEGLEGSSTDLLIRVLEAIRERA